MYVYLERVVNNRCLLYWSGYGDDGEEGGEMMRGGRTAEWCEWREWNEREVKWWWQQMSR